MVPLWISIVLFIVVAYYRSWDARVVGGGALIVGIVIGYVVGKFV